MERSINDKNKINAKEFDAHRARWIILKFPKKIFVKFILISKNAPLTHLKKYKDDKSN